MKHNALRTLNSGHSLRLRLRRSAALLLAAVGTLGMASVAHAGPPVPVPTTRLHVEFSHPSPSAGSTLYYRIRFENTGFKSVQIPTDLLAHLDIHGAYAMPWDKDRAAPPQARRTEAPPTVRWKTLKPDTFVELRGSLKDVFTHQCDKGCRSGDYTLTARLNYPTPAIERVAVTKANGSELSLVKVVPKGMTTLATLSVTPNRLPVGPEAVAFKLSSARQVDGETVEMDATFTNRSKVAVWIPKAHKLNISCGTRVIAEKNTRLQTVHHRKRSETPWRESEGVMLAPGDTFTQAVACQGINLGGAISSYIRARVRPSSLFFPTHVVSPFYLAAPLKSAEVIIKQALQTASR